MSRSPPLPSFRPAAPRASPNHWASQHDLAPARFQPRAPAHAASATAGELLAAGNKTSQTTQRGGHSFEQPLVLSSDGHEAEQQPPFAGHYLPNVIGPSLSSSSENVARHTNAPFSVNETDSGLLQPPGGTGRGPSATSAQPGYVGPYAHRPYLNGNGALEHRTSGQQSWPPGIPLRPDIGPRGHELPAHSPSNGVPRASKGLHRGPNRSSFREQSGPNAGPQEERLSRDPMSLDLRAIIAERESLAEHLEYNGQELEAQRTKTEALQREFAIEIEQRDLLEERLGTMESVALALQARVRVLETGKRHMEADLHRLNEEQLVVTARTGQLHERCVGAEVALARARSQGANSAKSLAAVPTNQGNHARLDRSDEYVFSVALKRKLTQLAEDRQRCAPAFNGHFTGSWDVESADESTVDATSLEDERALDPQQPPSKKARASSALSQLAETVKKSDSNEDSSAAQLEKTTDTQSIRTVEHDAAMSSSMHSAAEVTEIPSLPAAVQRAQFVHEPIEEVSGSSVLSTPPGTPTTSRTAAPSSLYEASEAAPSPSEQATFVSELSIPSDASTASYSPSQSGAMSESLTVASSRPAGHVSAPRLTSSRSPRKSTALSPRRIALTSEARGRTNSGSSTAQTSSSASRESAAVLTAQSPTTPFEIISPDWLHWPTHWDIRGDFADRPRNVYGSQKYSQLVEFLRRKPSDSTGRASTLFALKSKELHKPHQQDFKAWLRGAVSFVAFQVWEDDDDVLRIQLLNPSMPWRKFRNLNGPKLSKWIANREAEARQAEAAEADGSTGRGGGSDTPSLSEASTSQISAAEGEEGNEATSADKPSLRRIKLIKVRFSRKDSSASQTQANSSAPVHGDSITPTAVPASSAKESFARVPSEPFHNAATQPVIAPEPVEGHAMGSVASPAEQSIPGSQTQADSQHTSDMDVDVEERLENDNRSSPMPEVAAVRTATAEHPVKQGEPTRVAQIESRPLSFGDLTADVDPHSIRALYPLADIVREAQYAHEGSTPFPGIGVDSLRKELQQRMGPIYSVCGLQVQDFQRWVQRVASQHLLLEWLDPVPNSDNEASVRLTDKEEPFRIEVENDAYFEYIQAWHDAEGEPGTAFASNI